MKPEGVSSGRAGGIFEAFARLQQGLLTDNAGAMHVLRASVRVGDPPGAAQELHRLAPVVLDLYLIGPDIVTFLRLGLVLEIEGPDGDADATRRLDVVLSHCPTASLFLPRLTQNGWVPVVQMSRCHT